MKCLRHGMDVDDRWRLAQIVTETCTAITRRIHVFLADRNEIPGRAVWKIPRIENVLEHEFTHFNDRKWFESYRIWKEMLNSWHVICRAFSEKVTRLHKPVPSKTVVAMLLRRIGKGMDYREIGDKFGIRASTACKKVNEAMQFLVHSKLHII